jgi:RNA polymerase sigma-70 factor, ECF subfamily
MMASRSPSLDFMAVLQEHQAMVYSLALHFLRNPDLAQEIAQDVFLQLHRSLPVLKSEAHVVFWLRQVTCRRCIDSIRRAKARPEIGLDEAREPSSPPMNADPLLSERLRKLVASLPGNLRMAVVLRYQEDMEPEEIAEVLGLSTRAVRDHLRKGLELLRRKAGLYLGEV